MRRYWPLLTDAVEKPLSRTDLQVTELFWPGRTQRLAGAAVTSDHGTLPSRSRNVRTYLTQGRPQQPKRHRLEVLYDGSEVEFVAGT